MSGPDLPTHQTIELPLHVLAKIDIRLRHTVVIYTNRA